MKPGLTSYLRCISCAAPVALQSGYITNKDKTEIISGQMECKECHHPYEIRNGVPRMVDVQISTAQDVKTGDSFGHAWRAFPRLDTQYRQQMLDWVYPVEVDFLKDKLVLDCGCGKGRHTKVAAESGAKTVFAVDIGDAIDVAYKNVGHLPNVHVIQADVANLPFEPIMDYAFSIGVLDHMEQPDKGVASMAQKLNADGSVSVWVYGRENNWWIIALINPFRLAVTSRLPGSILKMVSMLMAIPVFLWSQCVIKPYHALQKSMPFLPDFFYQDYMYYISRFDFTEIHHIVHDHLVAPLANYSTREEVASWFKTAGMPDPILRWHNKNSWAGFSSRDANILESMRDRGKNTVVPVAPSTNPI